MEQLDLNLFKERALETTLWCNSRLHSVEPENISPDLLRSLVHEPDLEFLYTLTPQELQQFIDEVFAARTRLLSTSAKEITDSIDVMSEYRKGRLLAFFPYSNVDDGTAQIVSRGYFDVGGYPPWNTWIDYGLREDQVNSCDSVMIAWVPPEFIDAANEGIAMDPTSSLAWLTNLGTELKLVKQLADANLLI